MWKRICGTAWLGAGALAMTTSPAAAEGVAQAFEAAPGGTLTVRAEQAKLHVRGGDGNKLRVAIERRGDDAEDIEDDFDIDFEHTSDGLRLTVERRGRFFWNGLRQLSITVETPREFNADLKSSGGGVQVARLTGTVRAETSGGGLRFTDVQGPVTGRTSGGSIQVSGAAGNVDVTTSGGSISIGTAAGSVRARTSGGRIHIEQASGAVSAKTSGGSIKIGQAFSSVDAVTSAAAFRQRSPGSRRPTIG